MSKKGAFVVKIKPSVYQPVDRGALLVGRNAFFILFKFKISDKSLIKFLKSQELYQVQQNDLILTH